LSLCGFVLPKGSDDSPVDGQGLCWLWFCTVRGNGEAWDEEQRGVKVVFVVLEEFPKVQEKVNNFMSEG
jgi:hypothetical protein